ncbi:MAG: hypothetical protein ACOCUL_02800, partial [Bacteroidota bacterium]
TGTFLAWRLCSWFGPNVLEQPWFFNASLHRFSFGPAKGYKPVAERNFPGSKTYPPLFYLFFKPNNNLAF